MLSPWVAGNGTIGTEIFGSDEFPTTVDGFSCRLSRKNEHEESSKDLHRSPYPNRIQQSRAPTTDMDNPQNNRLLNSFLTSVPGAAPAM